MDTVKNVEQADGRNLGGTMKISFDDDPHLKTDVKKNLYTLFPFASSRFDSCANVPVNPRQRRLFVSKESDNFVERSGQ